MWKSHRSFLSGSQGGRAAVVQHRSHLRKMNECGERRALLKCLFNQILGVLRWFFKIEFIVCVCVCADVWTPNLKCHILFPAKHLAVVQKKRLVTEEVIMVSISSSQQGLTPTKPSILHWCVSTANLPVEYLSALQTQMHCVFSQGESTLICHLQTTIACWNSNLPCKVPFTGVYYLTGFHL